MDDLQDTQVLYDMAFELWQLGWSELVYDPVEDLFRFPVDTFAISRDRVNDAELERRSYSP